MWVAWEDKSNKHPRILPNPPCDILLSLLLLSPTTDRPAGGDVDIAATNLRELVRVAGVGGTAVAALAGSAGCPEMLSGPSARRRQGETCSETRDSHRVVVHPSCPWKEFLGNIRPTVVTWVSS